MFEIGGRLGLIAGPCVIESEEHVHFMAQAIRGVVGEFVFKASFDKANRTSVRGFRGPGMVEGLRILKGVRDELKIPVLTDIHEPGQAGPAAGIQGIFVEEHDRPEQALSDGANALRLNLMGRFWNWMNLIHALRGRGEFVGA